MSTTFLLVFVAIVTFLFSLKILLSHVNTSHPLKRLNYDQIVTDLKYLLLLTRQNLLCSCIIFQAGRQKFGSQCTGIKNPIGRTRIHYHRMIFQSPFKFAATVTQKLLAVNLKTSQKFSYVNVFYDKKFVVTISKRK